MKCFIAASDQLPFLNIFSSPGVITVQRSPLSQQIVVKKAVKINHSQYNMLRHVTDMLIE